MSLSNFKPLVAILMSLIISHIPELASAEVAAQMIPTQVVVEQMSRTQAEAKVRQHLDRDEVQRELMNVGISAEDAKSRLASLSDYELRQLAMQMDEAQYGGVTGILMVVVLVLLIIYLAKRI